MDSTNVINWCVEDVGRWLTEIGYPQYVQHFCDDNKIDGKALLLITEKDLRTPPMDLGVLGDIKRIIIEILNLKSKNQPALKLLNINNLNQNLVFERVAQYDSRNGKYFPASETVNSSRSEAQPVSHATVHRQMSSHLEPEYLKLVLSYVYMFLVFLLTSFVMVIVHDRVPDMEKYPPLPDLMLDNLPFIPWAFEMCELTAMILFIFWTITMFFHKHRFIVLRRMFALTGTVFLLRCITMLITSLSVPGTHLKCAPRVYDDIWIKVERTLTIWRGFGMSLQGVRTCGDYMFSGHTAVVTLLNFFITEYTPRKMHMLHTTTWIMNIFAVFFILAAHEHYSIDVFVSFYITSRLFLYYHSLANNRALHQPDHRRMRIWFPMFSYFESRIDGILPNEYEWPLPCPRVVKFLFQDKKNQ